MFITILPQFQISWRTSGPTQSTYLDEFQSVGLLILEKNCIKKFRTEEIEIISWIPN
jgi:hypothetical protein